MNEQLLRDQAEAGARYREHLDEYLGAIGAVEAQYADAWPETHDAAERENLWRAVQVCRKMKEHFGSLVSAGTLATHQLTEIKRLGK